MNSKRQAILPGPKGQVRDGDDEHPNPFNLHSLSTTVDRAGVGFYVRPDFSKNVHWRI